MNDRLLLVRLAIKINHLIINMRLYRVCGILRMKELTNNCPNINSLVTI